VRRDELRARAEEGRAPQPQLALVYAGLEQVRADSLQAEQAAEELAWRLGQLTGLGHAAVPIPGGGNSQAAAGTFHDAPLYEADVDAATVEANIEWQLAHAQKLQADAEASFASRAFFPDLSGFAMYNYRSSGSKWDPAGEWVAGLRLSFNLLDGGRSIAALSSTDAAVRAAEENLRAITQRTRIEREIALGERSAAIARMEAIEEAVRQKEVFVGAQRHLYASGRLSLSELETQETELLQLALQGKALRYQALRAAIQAARAAGTLTKEYLLMISGDDVR
jgi:outer membrane protein TolC